MMGRKGLVAGTLERMPKIKSDQLIPFFFGGEFFRPHLHTENFKCRLTVKFIVTRQEPAGVVRLLRRGHFEHRLH